MRGTINSKLAAVLMLLITILDRWIDLPLWVLVFPIGLVGLDLLGFCYALYLRRKELNRGELEEAKRLGQPDAAPVKRTPSVIPWGKLWLLVFLAMIFSPLLSNGGWIILLVSLLIGLPVLIVAVPVIGLCSALTERREEKRKGELEDAKKY